MPVNILNLSGLRVLDFKESEREYHINLDGWRMSTTYRTVTREVNLGTAYPHYCA